MSFENTDGNDCCFERSELECFNILNCTYQDSSETFLLVSTMKLTVRSKII